MSRQAPDLLRAIVAATRRRVECERASTPLSEVEAAGSRMAAPNGRFRAALLDRGRLNVIAECKRRSPSRGVLRKDYRPAEIAQTYERAGAAGISVLTEPAFFDGSLTDLADVRAHVKTALLRKDFTVDAYQVWQARAAGADAVLLIVGALDQDDLVCLLAEATRAGLDGLVEVHDEHELERALSAGADLVGVNNRNLRTLEVSLETSRRLAPLMPRDVIAVAESGLRTAADLVELRALGYGGFLIGEQFMTLSDPGAGLHALLAAAQGAATSSRDGSHGRGPCA